MRDMESLTDRVINVDKKSTIHSQLWEETKADQDIRTWSILVIIDEIKKVLTVTVRENERLGNEIVYLQCRSKKGNFLFYNFLEASDEEVCIDVVQHFCKIQLGFEDNIEMDRAPRGG